MNEPKPNTPRRYVKGGKFMTNAQKRGLVSESKKRNAKSGISLAPVRLPK